MNTRSLLPTLALLGISLSMTACVAADNSISISGLYMGDGSLSEEGITCEWQPGDTDARIVQRTIVDLKLLAEVGHEPFVSLGTHPTGTLVGVLGVGNTLQTGGSTSALDKNENDIYVKEVSINWTIDGESKYKPGKASSPGDACNGSGLRSANDLIATGIASKALSVELLTDKVPTTVGVTEISCLLGVLGAANGMDTSVPTEFIVEVQVLGETSGGVNVESPVLKIPVLVCEGCAEQFGSVFNFSDEPRLLSGATPMCSLE